MSLSGRGIYFGDRYDRGEAVNPERSAIGDQSVRLGCGMGAPIGFVLQKRPEAHSGRIGFDRAKFRRARRGEGQIEDLGGWLGFEPRWLSRC